MSNVIKKCLTCGGTLVPNGRGVPTCEFCGRSYPDTGGFSHRLEEIANRRQLREFIQAEELCRKLKEEQPESSEVYWQTLLATLGVVYVQDGEVTKPTFFSYSYDDRDLIKDNVNYKNAIKYASSSDERRYYEGQAAELDNLLKDFFNLVAKEASYDIFISFKRTVTAKVGSEERLIDTDDYYKAKEIYEFLSKKYKVFFSPVSIGQDTGIEGEKYEPRILKALQTSQAMVLLGGKSEYLEAQWVQNEWKRYLYFISKGKKDKKSLVLGYERNMPSLPPALKDIQLPSFDWYKASYLKELESKLSFVRTSKGIKSALKERKINSNFATDAQFGIGYSGSRISISSKSNNTITLSADEDRRVVMADTELKGKRYKSAAEAYSAILAQNPSNAKAYWGRFKSNIKVYDDSGVPFTLLKSKLLSSEIFQDIDSAIDCSNDIAFSWKIVDLLISCIALDAPWAKRCIVYENIIKYLDDKRVRQVLEMLSDNIFRVVKTDVGLAEEIFESSRKLFFEENKKWAMDYMRKYADTLWRLKQYEIARKYYEELASVERDPEVYMQLLACRVETQDVTSTIFRLNVNPDDDASIKKPSELDLDEIIERVLICNNEAHNQQIATQVYALVLHQVTYNPKYAKPFIETVVSCLTQLNQEEQVITFLMTVAERFLQMKNFKQAKVYYNEVLRNDPNCSKAHWGLVLCANKVMDDNRLIKRRNRLTKSRKCKDSLHNAQTCATAAEFQHYSDILSGANKQYYDSPYTRKKVLYPNKQAYLFFTKKQRARKRSITALICIVFICLCAWFGYYVKGRIDNSFVLSLKYGESTGEISYVTAFVDRAIPKLPGELTIEGKDYMEFVGWFTEPDCQGTQVANAQGVSRLTQSNINNLFYPSEVTFPLYAGFQKKSYTVTFYNQDGTKVINTKQIVYGTPISEVAAQFYDNHPVLTWTTKLGGAAFNSFISGEMTLYARDYGVHVTYDSDGGEDVPSVVIAEGSEVSLPVLTKQYSEFVGWTYNGKLVDEGFTAPYNDITLVAEWRRTHYIVKFTSQGTTHTEVVPVGDSVNLYNPTRTGYSVDYWTDSSGKLTVRSSFVPESDINLSAVWKANQYHVSLNQTRGTQISATAKYVTYDSSFSLPVPSGAASGTETYTYKYGKGASKTNTLSFTKRYVFKGWYTAESGGVCVTDYTGRGSRWDISSDTQLYAQWTCLTQNFSQYTNLTVNEGSHSKGPTVYLSNLFGYSLSQLKSMGYSKVTVFMLPTLYEKDDGYQEMYLCNSTVYKDKLLWKETKIEHGSGSKDGSTWTHYYVTTVELSALTSDTLTFFFDANGSFSDTWVLTKMDAYFELSK